MTAAVQKATLASENEVLANDKLITAREVIAAQKDKEKQFASDHLFSKELQRKERAQEEGKLQESTNKWRFLISKYRRKLEKRNISR